MDQVNRPGLWIDNTGLQSGGRCLDRKSSPGDRHGVDARSLLQLATQLVYFENVTINSFETPKIQERSQEILEKLVDLGVRPEALNMRDWEPAAYGHCCTAAAGALAKDLGRRFPEQRPLTLGIEPDIPLREQGDPAVHELISKDRTRTELQDVAASALKNYAAGAIHYGLATSGPLWDLLRAEFNKQEGWSEDYTLQLCICFRVYLNHELGRKSGCAYSPAIGRALLARRHCETALEKLETVAEDIANARGIANELRGVNPGLPSLQASLLLDVDGSPEEVVRRAVELRGRAASLRGQLASRGFYEVPINRSLRSRPAQTIEEFREVARQALRIEKAPRFIDAVKFLPWIPFIEFEAGKLMDWYNYWRTKRLIQVLTECSEKPLYTDDLKDQFELLQRETTLKDTAR
jgi:hypothetical protein